MCARIEYRWLRAAALLLILSPIGCSKPTSSTAPAGPATPSADGASKTEPAPKPDGGPQLIPPTKSEPQSKSDPKPAADQQASTEPTEAAGKVHTVYFRANDIAAVKIPKVALTRQEQDLCKLKVGDSMPAIELPRVDGAKPTKLADMYGKSATVVVFWKGDRRMTREEFADLGPDVIELFGKSGVAVVGVAVQETAQSAQELLTKGGTKFDNLLDADGKAFAQVGAERLPQTYVLDPSGKVVWFDIEYSLATRRELHDVLTVLTGGK
jgi:peroxiredoxin